MKRVSPGTDCTLRSPPVESPTAVASSAVDGATRTSPAGVMTTGNRLASSWAACSNRSPSGESEVTQLYGTALRARNSRAADDGAALEGREHGHGPAVEAGAAGEYYGTYRAAPLSADRAIEA